MFPWYYGIGTVCGLIALVTALSWASLPGKVHRLRIVVIVGALVTVGLGWYLEYKVEALREVRSATSDEALRAAQPSPDSIQAANDARKDFGRWHFYSLMANLLTVVLVTIAMGCTTLLPVPAGIQPSANDHPVYAGSASAGGQ
jgi:hypothetical protein